MRTLHIAIASLFAQLIAPYKTIAFVIHSVDRTLHIAIASLFAQLIAPYKTIAFVIHSVDRTLHIAIAAIRSVDRTLQDYRLRYPLS